MTAPADIIAALDASLAEHGGTVTLRRRVGTSDVYVSIECRARLSGYGAEALASGVKVTDSKFIMSPSEIVASEGAWPGDAGGFPWPSIGDWIDRPGRKGRIEQADAIVIGGTVVRIEGRVSG